MKTKSYDEIFNSPNELNDDALNKAWNKLGNLLLENNLLTDQKFMDAFTSDWVEHIRSQYQKKLEPDYLPLIKPMNNEEVENRYKNKTMPPAGKIFILTCVIVCLMIWILLT